MSTSKYNAEFYQRPQPQPVRAPPLQKRSTRSFSCTTHSQTQSQNKTTQQRFYNPTPYSKKLQYQGDQNKEKSVHDFDRNPITTASFITVSGVDDYKAQPFYKKPAQQRNQSVESKSMTHTQFLVPNSQYVCSQKKKLVPYHPYSQRNRFIEDDYVHKYYNNRSIVEVGKRMSYPEKMEGYKTMNVNNFKGLGLRTEMNNKNPGIAAYWHKWYKRNKL